MVDLVLSTVNKQQEGEKKQNESESGLSGHLEQLVMESAAENRDYLIQILDKLCFIVSAGQGDKENRKSEYPKREAEIAIDEMSEEAFEAFLSL